MEMFRIFHYALPEVIPRDVAKVCQLGGGCNEEFYQFYSKQKNYLKLQPSHCF